MRRWSWPRGPDRARVLAAQESDHKSNVSRCGSPPNTSRFPDLENSRRSLSRGLLGNYPSEAGLVVAGTDAHGERIHYGFRNQHVDRNADRYIV
jgi:hypothetical protein